MINVLLQYRTSRMYDGAIMALDAMLKDLNIARARKERPSEQTCGGLAFGCGSHCNIRARRRNAVSRFDETCARQAKAGARLFQISMSLRSTSRRLSKKVRARAKNARAPEGCEREFEPFRLDSRPCNHCCAGFDSSPCIAEPSIGVSHLGSVYLTPDVLFGEILQICRHHPNR